MNTSTLSLQSRNTFRGYIANRDPSQDTLPSSVNFGGANILFVSDLEPLLNPCYYALIRHEAIVHLFDGLFVFDDPVTSTLEAYAAESLCKADGLYSLDAAGYVAKALDEKNGNNEASERFAKLLAYVKGFGFQDFNEPLVKTNAVTQESTFKAICPLHERLHQASVQFQEKLNALLPSCPEAKFIYPLCPWERAVTSLVDVLNKEIDKVGLSYSASAFVLDDDAWNEARSAAFFAGSLATHGIKQVHIANVYAYLDRLLAATFEPATSAKWAEIVAEFFSGDATPFGLDNSEIKVKSSDKCYAKSLANSAKFVARRLTCREERFAETEAEQAAESKPAEQAEPVQEQAIWERLGISEADYELLHKLHSDESLLDFGHDFLLSLIEDAKHPERIIADIEAAKAKIAAKKRAKKAAKAVAAKTTEPTKKASTAKKRAKRATKKQATAEAVQAVESKPAEVEHPAESTEQASTAISTANTEPVLLLTYKKEGTGGDDHKKGLIKSFLDVAASFVRQPVALLPYFANTEAAPKAKALNPLHDKCLKLVATLKAQLNEFNKKPRPEISVYNWRANGHTYTYERWCNDVTNLSINAEDDLAKLARSDVYDTGIEYEYDEDDDWDGQDTMMASRYIIDREAFDEAYLNVGLTGYLVRDRVTSAALDKSFELIDRLLYAAFEGSYSAKWRELAVLAKQRDKLVQADANANKWSTKSHSSERYEDISRQAYSLYKSEQEQAAKAAANSAVDDDYDASFIHAKCTKVVSDLKDQLGLPNRPMAKAWYAAVLEASCKPVTEDAIEAVKKATEPVNPLQAQCVQIVSDFKAQLSKLEADRKACTDEAERHNVLSAMVKAYREPAFALHDLLFDDIQRFQDGEAISIARRCLELACLAVVHEFAATDDVYRFIDSVIAAAFTQPSYSKWSELNDQYSQLRERIETDPKANTEQYSQLREQIQAVTKANTDLRAMAFWIHRDICGISRHLRKDEQLAKEAADAAEPVINQTSACLPEADVQTAPVAVENAEECVSGPVAVCADAGARMQAQDHAFTVIKPTITLATANGSADVDYGATELVSNSDVVPEFIYRPEIRNDFEFTRFKTNTLMANSFGLQDVRTIITASDDSAQLVVPYKDAHKSIYRQDYLVDFSTQLHSNETLELTGLNLRFVTTQGEITGDNLTFASQDDSQLGVLVDLDSLYQGWLRYCQHHFQHLDSLALRFKQELFKLAIKWGDCFAPLRDIMQVATKLGRDLGISELFAVLQCIRVKSLQVAFPAFV